MRVRLRVGSTYPNVIPLGTQWGYRWIDPPGYWTLYATTPLYSGNAVGRVSSLEACSDEIHSEPYIDGPLEISKFRYSHYNPVSISADLTAGSIRYVLRAGMIPNFSPIVPIKATIWSAPTGANWFNFRYTNALSLAATAYNKFSPLKPRVDLGQTFAEIREIPRMLKSSASYFLGLWKKNGGGTRKVRHIPWYNQGKNTAGQWLNYNFGWVPFLGTIKDAYDTTINIEKIVDRLRRQNGVWEKRGGIVDETLSSDVMSSYSSQKDHMSWPSITSGLEAGGSCVTTKRVTRTTWFEADYRYYIPELERTRWPQGLIRQLYGLTLSPKLVYDLIPYSWLLDWFTNLGQFIEANSPSKFGQLVTSKACLMDHINEFYAIDITRKFRDGSTAHGFWTVQAESKRRHVQPSPFGFDVPLSGLSPWQTSILAALGWSRVKLRF